MKTRSLTLISILTFTINMNAQTNLAVTEFREIGISKDEATVLTERLRTELFQTNQFKIIEREMMNEVLNEQGFQQSGCVSDECIVEIGRIVGVEQIVGGSISKIADIYSVTAKIVSVETGEVLKIATYDCECPIDNLLKSGMQTVALKLIGQSAPATVTVMVDSPSPAKSNAVPVSPKGVNSEKVVEKISMFPFQIALFPPFQLVDPSISIYGLRINLFYGKNKLINGLDVGIVNDVKLKMRGLQAGVVNKSDYVWGLQTGVVCLSRETNFAQISVYNQSEKVTGTQIGVINITDTLVGAQIGLINIVKKSKGPKFLPIINIGF